MQRLLRLDFDFRRTALWFVGADHHGTNWNSALSQFCQRVGSSLQAGVDVAASGARRPDVVPRGSAKYGGHATSDFCRRKRGEGLCRVNSYYPPLVLEMVEFGRAERPAGRGVSSSGDHDENLLKVRRSFRRASPGR